VDQQTFREETPWGELVLKVRSGADPWAALILEGTFLMDSESSLSERALAARGLAALLKARAAEPSLCRTPGARTQPALRVLVGGLGLGVTLQELLTCREVVLVQVVEILPVVVEWNRGPLALLNGGALQDSRVVCHVGDLLDFMGAQLGPVPSVGLLGASSNPPFDLLLLDIDNGPSWLSLPGNGRLYTTDGFNVLRRCMAPRGVAVLWSTERVQDFEDCLAGLHWARWWVEEFPWQIGRGERTLCYYLYFLIRS
jgi:spermidine synthase